MTKAIGELDRLLRGETTKTEKLKRGILDVDASGLAVVILVLGLFYGACMGSFGIAQRGLAAVPQLIATTGKVPLLFLLTLIVTFPSLYVFNALVGSRLTLTSTLRLIVAAMAIMLAVLSSLGTIVAFFSVSTNDYSFMLLLNVVVFSVSGFLGMKFLLHTLHRLTIAQNAQEFTAQATQSITQQAPQPETRPTNQHPLQHSSQHPNQQGALDKVQNQAISANVTTIFRIWIVVFGLVGAQMGWVLRPFIGTPSRPFSLFRERDSNFFEAIFNTIARMLHLSAGG
ncbi:MAG TPA: hypothetical protein VGB77_13750 [Abditibacteriaceae bacterium]|jgi:hypothetical protein